MAKPRNQNIDPTELRRIIDYNPQTGEFRWLVNRAGRGGRIGEIAGCHNRGRRVICIKRKLYPASRIACAIMTGKWPGEKLVDHINCDVSDDRWINLRLANHSQNGANTLSRKSRKSLKGFSWDKTQKNFLARIKVNYKLINIGRFATAEEAQAAYFSAAKRYFGEFARI